MLGGEGMGGAAADALHDDHLQEVWVPRLGAEAEGRHPALHAAPHCPDMSPAPSMASRPDRHHLLPPSRRTPLRYRVPQGSRHKAPVSDCYPSLSAAARGIPDLTVAPPRAQRRRCGASLTSCSKTSDVSHAPTWLTCRKPSQALCHAPASTLHHPRSRSRTRSRWSTQPKRMPRRRKKVRAALSLATPYAYTIVCSAMLCYPILS